MTDAEISDLCYYLQVRAGAADAANGAAALGQLLEERNEARQVARDWFWDVIAEAYGGVDEILEVHPWLKR